MNPRLASIKDLEKKEVEGVFLFEDDIIKGPWFYLIKRNDGLLIHKIIFNDRYLNFYYLTEPSVAPVFYPNELKHRKKLTYIAPVKRYDLSGNFMDSGFIETKFELRETKDIAIPAASFKNCIKVFRSILFKTEKLRISVVEEDWFAPGVGKVIGDQWIKIKREGQDLSFGVKYALTSAVIKGRRIGSSNQ
jgi:hypothetical protein